MKSKLRLSMLHYRSIRPADEFASSETSIGIFCNIPRFNIYVFRFSGIRINGGGGRWAETTRTLISKRPVLNSP